ncbi:MAG: sulfatase-like hydrolase/transferase [Spirochaetes bacterium]|nr:sulfatase-like hydrolase/transferase [Spirochaetota bacterium]
MKRIARRDFIRYMAAVWGAFGTLHAAPTPESKRPNVLFLMTDQHYAQALGAAGNSSVRTPALDALATRGVRFEKSYCTYPLCCPGRASLFTSRMPHELGIYGNTDAELAEKGVPTLGELFREAGYDTAYAGKWHLKQAYPTFKRGSIPGFTALPIAGDDPHAQDKDKFGKGLVVDPNTADAANAFLRKPHAKPFFLVASFLNPHDICEYGRCAELTAMLPADPGLLPPVRPNTHAVDGLPSALAALKPKNQDRSDREWREYLYVYERLIEKADAHIGSVMETLRQTGLAESTIVVFTSDHGEMMGSHLMTTKEKLYDEAANVPLIVAAPGVNPRVDSTSLVSGLDVMPTLLDYAGITAPATLRGRSLRALVEGRRVPWRDAVFAETVSGTEARMVRTARYKYIVYSEGSSREQFFNLESDPGETRNLAGDPSLTQEVERHRALLRNWVEETRDPFGKMARVGNGKDRKRHINE